MAEVNIKDIQEKDVTYVIGHDVNGKGGKINIQNLLTVALETSFPMNIVSPITGDVLYFSNGAWTNLPKTNLTDGGNF